MKIEFSRKQLKITLYFGMAFMALGIVSMIAAPNALIFYWFLPMGFVYFSSFLYNKRKGYALITDKKIKKQGLFGKEIKIDTLNKCRYFAGDYIFANNEIEIVLSEKIIHPNSIEFLKGKQLEFQSQMDQTTGLK